VREILRRLEDGVARLAPYQKPSGVILYTTMAFARGFLLRRMGQFRAELPDVDLWLDTSERKVDFATDEVDILITFAGGVAAHGTIDAHLMEDKRVPVAAPGLMSEFGGAHSGPASIAGWPLLHDESEVSWRQWFAQIGRSDVDPVSGSNFSDHALMIDAAADGQGVALASAVCAAPYLQTGALVALEGPCVAQPAYRIYCDLRSYDDDQVRRVYEWFIHEAERSERASGISGI